MSNIVDEQALGPDDKCQKAAGTTIVDKQRLTRQRVLSAAETVFARLGFERATLDLIAAEAGYTRGAIYFNFPNKEALFLAVSRLHLERDIAELRHHATHSPRENLLADVGQWLRKRHVDSRLPAEFLLHARQCHVFAGEYKRLQEELISTLAMVMEAYFDARSEILRIDAPQFAQAVIALAHGLSLKIRGDEGVEASSGHGMDDLLRMLVHSWLVAT